MSKSNNFSNYMSYIQLMLMTSKSYKELRVSTNGYIYKRDKETTDTLKRTISELHLVGKINHEIFIRP